MRQVTLLHITTADKAMEVDRTSFWPRLLEMLEDMAKSYFVAIDFEFSGISSKVIHAAGKQTLQERYLETKEAAERYQILQIGLTFAVYDDENQQYILKPYNMNLNPLIEERLDIERIFSFQSGAAEFLLRHGFNLHEPFKNGVPYLSRDEAALAKQVNYDRLTRKNIQDMVVNDDDIEALSFLKELRLTIDAWKERNPYGELEISSRQNPGMPREDEEHELQDESSAVPRPGLTRFEKRLVHQFVRGQYPDLVTISGRDSIRIKPLDEEREAEHLRKKKHAVKEQIARQTGFRWIIEALVGNSLRQVDIRSFSFDPDTGMSRCVDLNALQSRFDQACASIRHRRIPLVGHNMFTDLVYFYRTFIGTLPATVEDFAADMHQLVPTIVDTKFLATHNCGDIPPASSLQEIADQLQRQEKPRVETPQTHAKYVGRTSFHEAGYDSYLTALVAIRLSAKLEHEQRYAEQPKEEPTGHNGNGNGVLKNVMKTSVSLFAPSSGFRADVGDSDTSSEAKKSSGTASTSRFTSVNVFEKLGMLSFSDDSRSEGSEYADVATKVAEATPSMTKMPDFQLDFWNVYGNKLRMFGTVDGMLDVSRPTAADGQ